MACAVYDASLAFWKNLQRKAGTLTNLLLGYKKSIFRMQYENEVPYLGILCLGMRCMEVVNVKFKVILA
jgi:hypothetical protein